MGLSAQNRHEAVGPSPEEATEMFKGMELFKTG